jgi:hypothetical protein
MEGKIVSKQGVEHRHVLVQERVPPSGVRDADVIDRGGRDRCIRRHVATGHRFTSFSAQVRHDSSRRVLTGPARATLSATYRLGKWT